MNTVVRNGALTAGCELVPHAARPPGRRRPAWRYTGNFWWANVSYLASLPDPEIWAAQVGSGTPSPRGRYSGTPPPLPRWSNPVTVAPPRRTALMGTCTDSRSCAGVDKGSCLCGDVCHSASQRP